MATGAKLNKTFRNFIEEQPMFFVATADTAGRVNVSPKGLDTLRIMDDSRIVWLNLSGSGNETAAHVKSTGRMTLMFCALQGSPRVLRVYGQAKVLHPRDPEWDAMLTDFPKLAGSRQVFDLAIDMVQTSCGSGVPIMGSITPRGETELEPWYDDMGPDGVKAFWERKNTLTVDGKPTGIFEDI